MTLRRISTFSRAKAPSQAETLGFTPTVDLLNQLPQQHRPVSAVVRGARKKKRVTALWAPRAGGEGALLAARQREKIEAVEARIDLTEDSGRLLIVLVGLPACQLRQSVLARSSPCGDSPLQRPTRLLGAVLWGARGEPSPHGCRGEATVALGGAPANVASAVLPCRLGPSRHAASRSSRRS